MSGNNTIVLVMTSEINDFFFSLEVLLGRFVKIYDDIKTHPNANLLTDGERECLLNNKLTPAWEQYNKMMWPGTGLSLFALNNRVKQISSVLTLTQTQADVKFRLKINLIHQLQQLIGNIPDFDQIEKEIMTYMDSLARIR